MKDLCLEHAIEGPDRFPAFGEAVQPRRKIIRSPRDLRLVTALLIWALSVMSIGFAVSRAHDDAAAKTQADSWLCKRP